MKRSITFTDMHTGGEPVRIIESGVPIPEGKTILEKIKYMRENYDKFRVLLMAEPRGHLDMYGVMLVPSDLPGMSTAAIFMHNEGYSTMCGHVTISLGRYLIDKGIVTPSEPITRFGLQCPCGPVEVSVEYRNGKAGNVSFQSVPCYIYQKDVVVELPDYGKIVVDIIYAGAFYALVSATTAGLKLNKESISLIRKFGGDITDFLRKQLKLKHSQPDIAFMYGTIVTDGRDTEDVTKEVCIFADRQVDRSPCGSGVSGRMAYQYAKGFVAMNQYREFQSITGATFRARVVKEVKSDGFPAVVVEVSGRGYYMGQTNVIVEEDDVIGKGFLLN